MRLTTIGLLGLLSSLASLSAQGQAPADLPPHEHGPMTRAPASTNPAPPSATPFTAAPLSASDKITQTHGRITIGGQPLNYLATTGYLPLKDESGKLRANIFFVAYTRESIPTPPATQPADNSNVQTAPASKISDLPARPLTFVFNGGPGAASAWLHLGTAGPYKVATPAEAVVPAPPGKLIENPQTWLTDTDLVFIDPVGTGYSRATTPEQSREFYSVNEDVASVAEFIRLYTTQYQRWQSPKFLAGESYGTTRAAALAEHLHDHKGLALNGVILISTVLNFADLRPQEGNDLPYALQLPTYTATAFYHHKLPASLQKDLRTTLDEVEKFTLDVYIPALAKGSNLDPNTSQKIAEQLASYTGLSVLFIKRNSLRIDPSRFEKELLNTETNPRILGRMDTRITAFTADAAAPSPDFDPSLSGYLPLYTSAFNSYVRSQLRYENDLPYEILSGRVGPWNFGGNGASGFLYVGDNLRNAMQKNPHLRVLVASGYFDLATPYFATDYTLSHLNLPAPLRDHLRHVYYPGGHMMYHEPTSFDKLHQDIARFIQQATAEVK